MTPMLTNVYINKWDDLVSKYSTIKMKPVDVIPSTYIYSSKKINNKDSNLKIGDIFRTWKRFCKRLFTKWSEQVFVIKKS